MFTIISGIIIGTGISLYGAISSFIVLFFGGLLVGSLLSLLIVIFIRRFGMQGYAFYLSLVDFLGAYAVAEALGASGATAVVASGLVLGWAPKKSSHEMMKEKLLDIWSNLSFIARSIIFLVLGAGFSVAALASVWVQAAVVTLVLFIVIRPLSVFASTSFEKKLSRKEKLFISWIGARGAVPAALAASAIGLGIAGAQQIFDIVIVVVLASLIVVGFSGRRVAKSTLSISSTDEKKKETK